MGFAAEIKEFLTSAKDSWKLVSDTDYKTALQKQAEEATTKSKEEREDPEAAESAKLKNALLRAKISAQNSATSNANADAASGRSAIDAANAPIPIAAAPPVIGAESNVAPPAVTPAPEFTGTGRKRVYARGGLVKKFAIGGMADDDDDEEDTATPQQAIPTATSGAAPAAPAVGPAIGGGAGYDIGARRRTPTPLPDTGVTAGLKYLAETSGIGQGAIQPALRQQAIQRYARGAGGAPAVDMAQVYKKIDPDNKLPESVRNLNAINSVYNFYMATNDPAKAKSAAAQMLQYYRTASSQYAALAKAAAGDGNMDAATKMFTKSYANVPDGQDAKLWVNKDGNIGYTIKNQDGTETHKGIMSPQQFGSQLMHVQPTDFDQHLITAAGERYNDAQDQPIAKPGKAKAGGGANEDLSGDPAQGKILEGVKSHVDDWLNDLKASKDPDKKKAAEDFSFKERKALETSMYHLQRNNDIPTAQAFDAAKNYLTAPEPKKEGDPVPFKVSRAKGSDTVSIQFANDGQTVEMPVNQFRVMDKLRDDYLAEQDAKAAKAKKDAAEPTWRDTIKPAVEGAGNIVSNEASRAADYVEGFKRQNPELSARVGSAVDTAKRAAGDTLGWLKRDWDAGTVPQRPTPPVPPNDDDVRAPPPAVPVSR